MARDAAPSHRFYLEIAGVVEAVFTEASGLQIEMETQDLEVGGMNDVNFRLPGRMKTGNLTLKRGMTNSNDFLKWLMSTRPGKIDRRNVSLVLYDVQGVKLLTWSYLKVFPVKWAGPTLTADGATVAIETVEFAHEGFTVA